MPRRRSRHPGLKKYWSKDHLYLYFLGTRVFAPEGSAEFEVELARIKERKVSPPGTLGSLIAQFTNDDELVRELASQQRRYKSALKWLGPYYLKPLDEFDDSLLKEIESRAYDARGRVFSKQVLVTLKVLLMLADRPRRCAS